VRTPAKDELNRRDGIEVGINLIDPSNRIIKSESSYIDAIPAGVTYYYGDTTSTDDTRSIVRLETYVRVRESLPRKIKLQVARDVRVVPEGFLGTPDVVGEIHNDGAQTLGTETPVTAVLFDSAGNVTGGGKGYLDFALPPGGREAFRISTDVAPGAIASVRVSVSANYVTTFSGCKRRLLRPGAARVTCALPGAPSTLATARAEQRKTRHFQRFLYGSDGTRTRDLRRDRSVMALPA
jgi:hypothetical protein